MKDHTFLQWETRIEFILIFGGCLNFILLYKGAGIVGVFQTRLNGEENSFHCEINHTGSIKGRFFYCSNTCKLLNSWPQDVIRFCFSGL